MYASPRVSAAVLSGFYDDEFAGDAGAFARSGDRGVAAAKVGKEERTAKEWAIPLVRRHLDPAGKRILDLRCRTGALSAALTEAGAATWSVDPFRPNPDPAAARAPPPPFDITAPEFHPHDQVP